MTHTVLFICTHNSARSQMAEAFLRQIGGEDFLVESAGFQPTHINPYVVKIMQEEGIDLAGKSTQSVFDLFKQGRHFAYVITVCDESEGGNCPIFPGITHRMHLPFPDPATFLGSEEEILGQTRTIRDAIKEMITAFVECVRSGKVRTSGMNWDVACKPGRQPC